MQCNYWINNSSMETQKSFILVLQRLSKEKLQMFTWCPFTDLQIAGKSNSYHRVLLQSVNITGFPQNMYTIFPCEEYRVSLWFLQSFSMDIAGKTYKHPVNTHKHLLCSWTWKIGNNNTPSFGIAKGQLNSEAIKTFMAEILTMFLLLFWWKW